MSEFCVCPCHDSLPSGARYSPLSMAGSFSSSLCVRMLVDGGSNCNLTCDPRLGSELAFVESPGSIGGIADALQYTGLLHGGASFGNAASSPSHSLAWLYTPSGTRNILSESVLLDEYGIQALKSPHPRLAFPDGGEIPMVRENGLWYVDVHFRGASQHASASAPPIAIASAAVRADDSALLWASRLGTDAEGLLRIANATRGVGIDKLSARQREAIRANEHRAVAQIKHAPAHATPLRNLAERPAQTLICDGFGVHAAPSPVDGAVYQFSAICEYSSFGYIASGKRHTIDDWLAFLRSVQLDAESHGHTIQRVRFDRAPELRSDDLKRRIEAELHMAVDLTPRERHEGVGRAERNNDLLTRLAEEMLQRAQLGTAWLLPARAYAQWLLNRQIRAGTQETRYQRYLRRVPDLTSPVPYVFGTTVAIVEDVRGPKGSLDHPRGSVGRFVGIDGPSHLVYRPTRGTTVHQSSVKPLNELALVRTSLPSSVAVADSETQTEFSGCHERECILPPPAQPAPVAPAAPKPPVVDVPLRTRVEVLWPDASGGGSTWWSGEIIDTHSYQNGRRRHHVAYDGWPPTQWYWHDLASNDFQWRRSDAPADENGDPAPPAGPMTRARARAQSHVATIAACVPAGVQAAVAAALEASTGECTATRWNALLYQFMGDAGESFEVDVDDAHDALDDARSSLANAQPVAIYSLARASGGAQCLKASQNIVDVNTPLGPAQLRVPATYAQLLKSEQRDEWLAAESTALDAVLAWPGNRLVPQSVPFEQSLPIAPCVTQRRIKKDAATGALAAKNAFKARHCVDGGRHSALLTRAGVDLAFETSSAGADDVLVKMLIGDAALRNRNLLKADVPNAYPQGKRGEGRPLTYMALPRSFAHLRDEQGQPLCIELTTPMWGEGPAGFEWQLELERTLLRLGWRRAENVPALWRFESPEGDALLITVVDDLLFSESFSSGHAISERTCAALSELYGDVGAAREPTSYVGYRLQRDREAGTINLSLEQKIVEAAREHMPELLEGGRPKDLPIGGRLHAMADAMQLAERTGDRLCPKQVRTQKLIGSLKFIERVHPRATLILHRLSCVMSAPPPEAYQVACAALLALWDERDVGITFGGAGMTTTPRLEGSLKAHIDLGEPAPGALEAHADATWGDRNLYGLILTYAGAAVLHQSKKISLIVDSSMESEAIGSSKAGEAVAYAREILRALGVPVTGPTLLTTDNLSNYKVGSGVGCPTRSKHFLRRYFALKQRIRAGDVSMQHVPDEHMPADFLTKWIPKPKLEKSIRYATNAHGLTRAGDE